MIKNIFLVLVIFNIQSIVAHNHTNVFYNDVNQSVVKGIINNDYNTVNNLLSKRLISSRAIVDGKPLIVHAVINDQPDMVNLLLRYGAQPYADYCDQGYNAHEWAVKSGSYYARAELIVVSILNN